MLRGDPVRARAKGDPVLRMALHEACHAVLAVWAGDYYERVEVYPGGKPVAPENRVKLASIGGSLIHGSRGREKHEFEMDDAVCVYLAGPAFAWLLEPTGGLERVKKTRLCDDDFEQVYGVLEQFTGVKDRRLLDKDIGKILPRARDRILRMWKYIVREGKPWRSARP